MKGFELAKLGTAFAILLGALKVRNFKLDRHIFIHSFSKWYLTGCWGWGSERSRRRLRCPGALSSGVRGRQ